MQRLACNTPDGTKRAGADADECHQPHSSERSAGVLADLAELRSTIGLWRLLSGLSDGGATLAALKAIESLATQHREHAGEFIPPHRANEGGMWPPERSLPA
jgi:hypothetical protein